MLGIGIGSPHRVMFSVCQAQCATRSRFPFPLLWIGKCKPARKNSEASQTGCFVMGNLADDISLIHLDFTCFGNQGVVTFCKYRGSKDDGVYFLATTRPIVPAIFRTLFMTGQNVRTRTFCFLTFFIFKYCTMEYVFVIGRVIGTNNSRKFVR